MTARDLQKELNYKKWENFEGVIKRANNLIQNGFKNGVISETFKIVETGFKAKRSIIDYSLDNNAVDLITYLCSNYKINKYFPIRNETLILGLIEKYYKNKNISFEFQKKLSCYVYDALIGGNILVEFDEPHHFNSKKQILIDKSKSELAHKLGYKLIRICLKQDIIDCIIIIDKQI